MIRIYIVREEVGFGAGSPDLDGFVLLAPTREEIERQIGEALAEHCGHPVEYRIMPTWG